MKETRYEFGTVTKVNGKVAFIEITKDESCNGCKACLFKSKENKICLKTVNKLDSKVGDKVKLSVGKDATLLSSFLVYILPIIFCVIGILISNAIFEKEMYIALTGIITLAVGYGVVMVVDKFISKKNGFGIEIIEIVNGEDKNGSINQ